MGICTNREEGRETGWGEGGAEKVPSIVRDGPLEIHMAGVVGAGEEETKKLIQVRKERKKFVQRTRQRKRNPPVNKKSCTSNG